MRAARRAKQHSRPGFAIWAYGIATLFFLGASAATPSAQQLKNWALTCQVDPKTSKLVCQMSQSLFERQSGRQVLSLVIRPGAETGALAVLFGLPHGLDLASGISFNIDGGEKGELAFQTSDRNGVYAAMPLTEEAIEEMIAGNVLNVVMTSAQGKEITVGASLIGFTAALEQLRARTE